VTRWGTQTRVQLAAKIENQTPKTTSVTSEINGRRPSIGVICLLRKGMALDRISTNDCSQMKKGWRIERKPFLNEKNQLSKRLASPRLGKSWGNRRACQAYRDLTSRRRRIENGKKGAGFGGRGPSMPAKYAAKRGAKPHLRGEKRINWKDIRKKQGRQRVPKWMAKRNQRERSVQDTRKVDKRSLQERRKQNRTGACKNSPRTR